MRLIFMGTPEFSVPALDALVQSQYEILCVYTQPPRPAGRGKKYKISAVHKYADNLGILVKNPSKLNTKLRLSSCKKQLTRMQIQFYSAFYDC